MQILAPVAAAQRTKSRPFHGTYNDEDSEEVFEDGGRWETNLVRASDRCGKVPVEAGGSDQGCPP